MINLLSLLRKQESSCFFQMDKLWIPAFAGMTQCEAIFGYFNPKISKRDEK